MKLLAIMVLAAGFAAAAELPELFNDPALQHFYNLEFDEALALFQERAAKNPASAELQNLIAQTLIFRTMYKAGALDSSLISDKNPFFDRPNAKMSPEDEKMFFGAIGKAMEISKPGTEKKPPDPQALYDLGITYGLKGNYNFIIKKAWLATLRDATQARKLHARVLEIQPDNIDAKLTQGLHTYIAGNLVFPWKQLGFLAGFRGDKWAGIVILREVVENGQKTKVDATVFLQAIYRRDHISKDAIPLALNLIQWFPRNYIFRMELANLYRDVGDRAKAQEVVTTIEQMKKDHAPGYDRLPDAKLAELKKSVNP